MPTIQKDKAHKEDPAAPAPDSLTPERLTHEEHEDHIHRRKDELLDHGVEETFPASDPVAVKHIT